jgi:hypothetical protein
MTWTLETKEGRAYAGRLIKEVLKVITGDEPNIETGEGEGQGEVSFENLFVLGQEDGYAISYAVEVPATRWEPSGVDIVEVAVVASLDEAIELALKTHLCQLVDVALEGERMVSLVEEEQS